MAVIDTVADTININGTMEEPFVRNIPEGLTVGSLYDSSGGLLDPLRARPIA